MYFVASRPLIEKMNILQENREVDIITLYWSGQLVCTPALGLYTGMDKTSLDTSSRTLFVKEGGCPRHVERRVT